jgi:hypothetical protein
MASGEALGIVAALTAVFLTACAPGNVHPSPTTSTSPTATASAAPSISPHPTVTPATPSRSPIQFLAPLGPSCSAAQLEVRLGQGFGALGNGITYLIFTDHGTKPCTLRGTPEVQLLDSSGRPLAIPRLHDAASGYVPTFPNNGVGLTPLKNQGSAPGPNPEGGIRSQASLPLQYYEDGCGINLVSALRIRLVGGAFTVLLSLPGGGPGCEMASEVLVNPFQPAEFLP